MDSVKKIETLPIFKSMSKDDVILISEISEIKKFPAKSIIFEEDSFGNELYIILSGVVQISKKIKENIKRPLATLRVNSVFGEIAVISDQYRSAEASAVESSELLCISKEQFEKFISTSSDGGRIIQKELISILAARLKTTTELYKHSVDWGLSISGILELNFKDFISQNTELKIALTSGKEVRGILLRADKTPDGTELILETPKNNFLIIPYSSIASISFDRNIKFDLEE